MKNIVAVMGLLLVGCGSANTGRVCVAHVRGTCSAYELRHPTESEQQQEDLDRRLAAARGVAYTPPWREGESATDHLTRMTEEHDRQAAAARGEPYFSPQRRGESSSSWMKRVQSGNYSSSNNRPSLGSMPSFGSSNSSGVGSSSSSGLGSRR